MNTSDEDDDKFPERGLTLIIGGLMAMLLLDALGLHDWSFIPLVTVIGVCFLYAFGKFCLYAWDKE